MGESNARDITILGQCKSEGNPGMSLKNGARCKPAATNAELNNMK
jgi:hypothetical protein